MNGTTFDEEFAALRAALAGQYTLERELGRGGMGVVFLARDEKLDRRVAIKVLPPPLSHQVDVRERFLREARTAAQLSHPHIVPIHRADELSGNAFFVMGYIEGETLAAHVRDRGALPVEEAVRYLREVAWALAYAHARGVVHRDVKPENILIERGTGRALVTDFGIARAPAASQLTQTGHVLGTVHYMSPEQAAGDEVDGRSDLYSLGVVGFYALSGALPFHGPNAAAILVAHAMKPAPPLATVFESVPRPVAAVIDRCLAKAPQGRFASGEALAEALARALSTAEADESVGASGGRRVLSEPQAAAVWRRAAQLQAEAAMRLEERTRVPQDTARPEAAGDSAVYKLRDVEAAAVEAGISQRFVALALSELAQDDRGEGVAPIAIPQWQEKLAVRMLGTSERSVAVTRTVRAEPRRVLAAIGRTFQSVPLSLTLIDTVGGHPLEGGILIFEIPGATGMETSGYKWTWTRYSAFVTRLRVSLRAALGSEPATEVTVWIDLRDGARASMLGSAAFSAGGAVVGGALGTVLGIAGLGLAGALVALPVVAGVAALGAGGALGARATYRFGLRRGQKEFHRAIDLVEASLRSERIFGESAPVKRAEDQAGMSGLFG